MKVGYSEDFTTGLDGILLHQLVEMRGDERDSLRFVVHRIAHLLCEWNSLAGILKRPENTEVVCPAGLVLLETAHHKASLAGSPLCLLKAVLKDRQSTRCSDHDHGDADRVRQ